MRKIVLLVGVMIVVLGGPVAAQTGNDHPGYYAIEEMGILAAGDLEVDVNLQGAMLQAVASSMEGQEGDVAELVSGLDRVRVQVGAPQKADASTINHAVSEAVANLEGSGWDRILRVEEDDEQIYLFSREDGGMIVGFTVLVNDGGEEVVLVNIAGAIDPETFGRALAKMDEMPDLDELMAAVEQ
jgi:hypothetical protein